MRKAEVNDVRCRLSGKIGANVKFLRTMRKLRQQDVAQTLGISQTHLSNMECGRVKFSLKQLLRLANLFDCQLECFFDPRQAANVAVGGTGQDKRYTQSDMELLLTLVKKAVSCNASSFKQISGTVV